MVLPQTRTVLGIVGDVTSFLLLLSPGMMYYNIIRTRSVANCSPVPCLVTLLNSVLWLLYASSMIQPNGLNITLIVINGAGVAIEAVYLLIFVLFSSGHIRRDVLWALLLEVLCVAGLVGVCVIVPIYSIRAIIVGMFCILSGIGMYASTLPTMFEVIHTRSVKLAMLPLLIAGCLNTVIWMAYSLIQLDIYILVQNSVGLALNVVQLTVFFWYYRTIEPAPPT